MQENHYYPFGLNITSLEKSGQPECSWQFGGVEKQEEFGLNWLHYKYRFYDVQVSRFFSVDPIAEDYVYLTPYQHASNNPASKIEIEGLEGDWFQNQWNNSYTKAVLDYFFAEEKEDPNIARARKRPYIDENGVERSPITGTGRVDQVYIEADIIETITPIGRGIEG